MNIKIIILVTCLIILFSASLYSSSPWLGRDKVMHFLGSAYLTYWNYGISYDVMEKSDNTSLLFSVCLTTFLGAGKEYSDKHIKKTRWSWHDMTYNVAGIIFGVFLVKNLR